MVSFSSKSNTAALSRRVPTTFDKDQTSVSSESTNVLSTSRKVKLSMITHTLNRPRQGVKHLTVLAVFVGMCLSAAHGMKRSSRGNSHATRRGDEVELHAPTKGKGIDIGALQPAGEEESVACPHCGHQIPKAQIERYMLENYFLRNDWDDKNPRYGKDKRGPFAHDEELQGLIASMEEEEKTQLKIDSLGDKSKKCEWAPARERGFRKYEFSWGTCNPKTWIKFENYRDTYTCPKCSYELVIGDDKTLTKKIYDRMFTGVGMVFSSIVAGSCFASYIMDLRSEGNIQDSYGAHLFFFLGLSLMLFFLLRGHGWDDGNNITKIIKGLGFSSGLGAGGVIVAALSRAEDPNIGADGHIVQDLDFNEMYASQSHLFFIGIFLGCVALLMIILVNYHHNKRPGGNKLQLLGTFTMNFFLVMATFGGLVSFGDSVGRMSAEDSSVAWDSFALITVCAVYVIFYLWWKVMRGKAKVVYQIGTCLGGLGTVVCLMSYLSYSQNGLSEIAAEDENLCQLAMWVGVIFFLMMILSALKVNGAEFNFCPKKGADAVADAAGQGARI